MDDQGTNASEKQPVGTPDARHADAELDLGINVMEDTDGVETLDELLSGGRLSMVKKQERC